MKSRYIRPYSKRELIDWKYGLDHIFPDYRFCPMCGRDLKGEDNG